MRQYEDGRAFAQKKDQEDPLKDFQQRFYKQEGVIYMDGNSLGLCSKDAEKALMNALEVWKKPELICGRNMITSCIRINWEQCVHPL